jgi:hypothetical protein
MYLDQNVTSYSEATGELFINLMHINVRLKYEPWNSCGMKIYRRSSSKWVPFNEDPGIPVVNIHHEENSELPVNRYASHIPKWIVSKASHFYYLQTSILQSLSILYRAKDLFDSNPLILWLLVDAIKPHRSRFLTIDRILKLKMVDVLRHITFDLNIQKSCVKFLRKIQLSRGAFSELQIIKRCLKNERCIRDFRHWAVLPIHILAAWETFPDIFASNFGQEISLIDFNDYTEVATLVEKVHGHWDDILRLADCLKIGNVRESMLMKCKTEMDFHKVHDDLVQKLNRSGIFVDGHPFPNPPIPGNENIRPILNSRGLLEEGKFMGHCVGGYTDSVRKGQSFIYSVHYPERCTMEITGSGLSVRIRQLKLANNGEPGDATWKAVRKWVDDFQQNQRLDCAPPH